MMDFTAIDFETATGARNSACSVAVVTIRDGQVADSYYTLIQPPENRYNYFNTQIHGLTKEDTKDAADFAGIWPELEEHLAGQIVVAHNAKFDMGVLRACLSLYGLSAPEFSYCDTLAIARSGHFSICISAITMLSRMRRPVRPSQFTQDRNFLIRALRPSCIISASISSRSVSAAAVCLADSADR